MSSAADEIDRVIAAGAFTLEVGCGSQPYHRTSVGLDCDHHALAAVRAVAVCGDACRLPFGDGSFDVVVARGVLHHLENLFPFVSEARRVSRVGGALVVLDAEPMPMEEYEEMSRQLAADENVDRASQRCGCAATARPCCGGRGRVHRLPARR